MIFIFFRFSRIFLGIFQTIKLGLFVHIDVVVRTDRSNRCGRQLHTDLCQNKVQTYQFNENNSN